MRILNLELHNVRQFSHKRLEFGPGFNLLVGDNGAGKSTVLRALITALGTAENFTADEKLADDDIRHRAHEFRVKVEYQAGETTDHVEIHHGWRESTKRVGHRPKTPIIWFGPNESVAKPLRGEKFRRYRSEKRERRWDRDEFWFREEFLFHEEFMDPSEDEKRSEFGQSGMVRRFVGRILSEFSPKFHRFAWRFLPYDCVVRLLRPSIRSLPPILRL